MHGVQKGFSKANAEVMRNSLPLCPPVGGWWRWPGGCGQSPRSRRHSASVILRREGGRGAVKRKTNRLT